MSDEQNADDAKYGFFKTDDGGTVVYDRNNPKAWIQSTFAVAVGGTSENETTA